MGKLTAITQGTMVGTWTKREGTKRRELIPRLTTTKNDLDLVTNQIYGVLDDSQISVLLTK